MSKGIKVCCALGLVLFAACNDTLVDPVEIVNHPGIVRQLHQDVYIIIDTVENGSHYAPTNLPEAFSRDGMRVLFSGSPREIPPHVRMAGIPLDLTSIEQDIR